jgi:hypothetical protein
MVSRICLAALLLIAQAGPAEGPHVSVDRLLDADRGFSAAGAGKSAVESISAMFADDVILPGPGPAFTDGRAGAIEALKANADNVTGRVTWSPVRGGISADGTHGFTFGYMTMTKADGTSVPMKYLDQTGGGVAGRRLSPAAAPARQRHDRADGTIAARAHGSSVE